jgi:hypothetical protein
VYRIIQGFFLVLACATLAACAGSQPGWQDGYAATSGYYDASPSYGYRYNRPPRRAPCQCSDDRYDDYRDDDYYRSR